MLRGIEENRKLAEGRASERTNESTNTHGMMGMDLLYPRHKRWRRVGSFQEAFSSRVLLAQHITARHGMAWHLITA